MIRDQLPNFLLAVREVDAVVAAEQPELDLLEADAERMLAGFRVRSAGVREIALWEDFLGFSPAPEWSLERRRERVRTRIIVESPVSEESLKRLIEAAGGVECEIHVDAAACRCTVKFVGEFGIPRYLTDIRAEVARVIPLHVAAEYAFTFTTLAVYKNFALGALGDYTLQELSEGEPFK